MLFSSRYRPMSIANFYTFLTIMAICAVIVFFCLYFVDAGYGKFYNSKWGPSINNRLGWVLYFQRSFIFPLLIRGESRMPVSIILMGVLFNTLNAFMQGGWLFYVSPADMYPPEWLHSFPFFAGTLLFFAGMFINIQSDSIIRNLRQPGDTAHYLPTAGMFRYVSSANYFGEVLEWNGFAILTWSWAGAVFALWTFANLGPRAARIHKRYQQEFPTQFDAKKVKRIIPLLY